MLITYTFSPHEASFITAVEYFGERNEDRPGTVTVRIETKDGLATYEYTGVYQFEFFSLVNAESVGGHFNSIFKPKREFRKVG